MTKALRAISVSDMKDWEGGGGLTRTGVDQVLTNVFFGAS